MRRKQKHAAQLQLVEEHHAALQIFKLTNGFTFFQMFSSKLFYKIDQQKQIFIGDSELKASASHN